MNTYVLMQSESGDWFIVPLKYRSTFVEDELEEKADYARYVPHPDRIVFREYQELDSAS